MLRTILITLSLIIGVVAVLAAGLKVVVFASLGAMDSLDGLSQIPQFAWAITSAILGLAVANVMRPIKSLGQSGMFVLLIIGTLASVIASFGGLSFIFYMLSQSGDGMGWATIATNLANVSVSLLSNLLTILIFLGFISHNQKHQTDELF